MSITNSKHQTTIIILLCLVLGIIIGLFAKYLAIVPLLAKFLFPFGKLFINALKFIAVPLVIISLLNGIIALTDLSRLGKIAIRTIIIYLLTTTSAVILGLILGNLIQPGTWISDSTRKQLLQEDNVSNNIIESTMPLDFMIHLFPDWGKIDMIVLIVLSLFFAVAAVRLPKHSVNFLRTLFASLNDWVLEIVTLIIRFLAPIGVIALMAEAVAKAGGSDLFYALIIYGITVILGLTTLTFIFYPLLVQLSTKLPLMDFIKGMIPAQLIAFSTSSSAATLSMTIKCVEENLHVKKEIAGFVLPTGATINMDGTSLYQGIVCLFIAQAFGLELAIQEQFLIIGAVVISSIGAAAVPGGGIAMLAIVLEQVGLPAAGLGLILGLDRPLDMLRTVANVTGDAAVSVIVNHQLDKN